MSPQNIHHSDWKLWVPIVLKVTALPILFLSPARSHCLKLCRDSASDSVLACALELLHPGIEERLNSISAFLIAR